jgi:hypothetical protein
VKPLQFVITRTALGPYKICVMDLKDGAGKTLANYRGGLLVTLWRVLRLLFQLRAP